MAEIYPTHDQEEPTAQTATHPRTRPPVIPSETPVGLYERPAQTLQPLGVVAGIVLFVLVLLGLAYYVFQWWT